MAKAPGFVKSTFARSYHEVQCDAAASGAGSGGVQSRFDASAARA
jgi:hypothetical protein